MMKTYKQMIADGTATDEIMADLVGQWHEDVENQQELYEFLGFESLDDQDRATRPHVYENLT